MTLRLSINMFTTPMWQQSLCWPGRQQLGEEQSVPATPFTAALCLSSTTSTDRNDTDDPAVPTQTNKPLISFFYLGFYTLLFWYLLSWVPELVMVNNLISVCYLSQIRQLCHITAGPCILGTQPGAYSKRIG